MYRCILSVLLCAIITASVRAEIVMIEVDDSKPGSFIVNVDSQGNVTARPIKRIIKIGTTPTTPETPTTPTDLKPFQEQIKKETLIVLDGADATQRTTCAAISSIYSIVSDRVSKGEITDWVKAVKEATDSVMIIQGSNPKWDEFRKRLSAALNTLSTAGELDSTEDVAAILKAISAGMNEANKFNPSRVMGEERTKMRVDASHAKQAPGILDGINIEQLIKLIELIMSILDRFGK